METKILKTDDESIAEAGRIAAQGGLVAFPTETVYGLGASAYDETSVARIYAAKGRPSDNPLIVHIADISDIDRLAESVSAEARRLTEAFMPGPFTIILKKSAIVRGVRSSRKSSVRGIQICWRACGGDRLQPSKGRQVSDRESMGIRRN